jgi:hypothetical protein
MQELCKRDPCQRQLGSWEVGQSGSPHLGQASDQSTVWDGAAAAGPGLSPPARVQLSIYHLIVHWVDVGSPCSFHCVAAQLMLLSLAPIGEGDPGPP